MVLVFKWMVLVTDGDARGMEDVVVVGYNGGIRIVVAGVVMMYDVVVGVLYEGVAVVFCFPTGFCS